jgi:hypothetical protein
MRIVSLIFIAIITFVIVLIVKRPELFKDFWLWLIGLSGLVLHALQTIWNDAKGLFSKASELAIKKEKEIIAKIQSNKKQP